jgi:hypothetical protein
MLGTTASAQVITETFGTGANSFSIDFVQIGNPGNAADTTGSPNPAGSVGYVYNIGKYEISRDMIVRANLEGNLGITLQDTAMIGDSSFFSSVDPNKPASGISWNEAARFVNWLNTSRGYQAAYNFATSGANDNASPWDSGQFSGNNQFRHKDAYYFLPNSDEWYKPAYGSPSGAWYRFPTGSDTPPIPVAEGTDTGSAVYAQSWDQGPADFNNAGGLSPYGTVAQGGNMWEWTETAYAYGQELRGGPAVGNSDSLESSYIHLGLDPTRENYFFGFRVAMVPEPSSLSLLALGGVVVLRRRG